MATCSGVETAILECEGGGTAGVWSILSLVVNIFSVLVGIVAVIGITLVGIQYLTAGGDVAKATKAKKRMFQIAIGIVAYVVLWGFVQWLSPGGIFNPPNDIESVAINFSGDVYVGSSAIPKVTVTPEGASDKSFSLSVGDKSIASAGTSSVRCLKVGQTTVTVTTVNNKTGSTTINCVERLKPVVDDTDDSGSGGSDNSGSSDPGSSGSAFSPSQISDFMAKWNSLGDQDWDEVKNLAMSRYGITESDFVGLVGWARIENYENHAGRDTDVYMAYLCNNASLNLAMNNKGKFLSLLESGNWGSVYTTAGNYGRNGYYQSNLKSVRMALDYHYPNITNCNGMTTPSNYVYHWTSINGVNSYVW